MLDSNLDRTFLHKPRKPFFVFPEIKSFAEFSFEKLTPENAQQLCLLFRSDASPFIDHRFKTESKSLEYARFVATYGAYLAKHGCQDWLVKYRTNYAGVVHLYDLSLETFAENHKRAWIGFATTQHLRNKGLTYRVLKHFIHYVFGNYSIDYLHSMTSHDNYPAAALLGKCGFLPDVTERLAKEYWFYEFKRSYLK
jgi:RimJ/RimL family protein N-acetyltransferase